MYDFYGPLEDYILYENDIAARVAALTHFTLHIINFISINDLPKYQTQTFK